jgi:hypothetical protein
MSELIQPQLNKVLAELKAIPKAMKAPGIPYAYRGIYNFLEAINPLFKKHGITVQSTVKYRNDSVVVGTDRNGNARNEYWCHVTIAYEFTAEDGSVCTTEAMGTGNDFSDKAVYKAQSGAFKYALTTLLSIPTDDLPDPDHEIITSQTPKNEVKQGPPAFATEQQMAEIKTIATTEKCPDGFKEWAKTQEIKYSTGEAFQSEIQAGIDKIKPKMPFK